MTQEKSLLISSIHKLIKHIKQGPKNQHQIFNSLSKRDIQKIIKNVDDSNIQLRKASFSLITNLLGGPSSNIRISICNHLKLPIIPGRIIMNPKMLANLDSLDLKDVIYLIKTQESKEVSMSSQNFSQGKNAILWQINLIQFPLRMQELFLQKVQNMDPKYCIFGITLKQQDTFQGKYKEESYLSKTSDYRYTFNSKQYAVQQQQEKKNSPYFGNNWVKEPQQNPTIQSNRPNSSNTATKVISSIKSNQYQQTGDRNRITSDYTKYKNNRSNQKNKQQSANHKSITGNDYIRLNGTINQSNLNNSIRKQEYKETIQPQKWQYRNPVSSPNIYQEPKSHSQQFIDIDKTQNASYQRNIQPTQKFYVNPYGTIHKPSIGLNKSIGFEKPADRQQISSAGRKNVYAGYTNKTNLISSSQQYGATSVTYRNISSKTMYQPTGLQINQGYKGAEYKHSKLANKPNTDSLAFSVKHQYPKNL